MEVRGLRHLAPQREIYCTMEIEGSETGRLQTEHVPAKKPLWDTQGDFTTNHPLPVLKIKLYAVNPSMLSLEDKELGKLVLRPTVLSPKTPEWWTMQAAASQSTSGAAAATSAAATLGGASCSDSQTAANSSTGANSDQQNNDQQLKIRAIVRMDRPQQLKHCGFLYGIGKSTWRKFKRRYHILIQVSQYTFVMCAYREKKAKPTEMLQLDGYTVDYIEPPTDMIMEHCAEMAAARNEHHSHSSASSTGGTFGLAGRLAKPFLSAANRQQQAAAAAAAAAAADELDEAADSAAPQQQSAIQTAAALSDELHNKYYFNVVKEGDSVVFACDDEQECFGWVMALYRATGQAHKPTPLRNQYKASDSHYIDAAFAYNAAASGQQQTKLVGNSSCQPLAASGGASGGLHTNGGGAGSALLQTGSPGVSGAAGGAGSGGGSAGKGGLKLASQLDVADQRARKHGMDEFISADPCKFQHNHLFRYLQNSTLRHRLQDKHCSLGWLAPGQLLVLDEYCARYGVRTCFRHLAYLNSLLDFSERNYFIDHTLLNYCYDFCASFVSGKSSASNPMSSVNFDLRPDGIGTVTVEERDLFHLIKAKLLKLIERQISNFTYCFPFGKPDGALKATLSLLERVLMKENRLNSVGQNEEVRNLIRKCLEQAALNNYTRLSGQANLLASDERAQLAACLANAAGAGNGQLGGELAPLAELVVRARRSGAAGQQAASAAAAAPQSSSRGSVSSAQSAQFHSISSQGSRANSTRQQAELADEMCLTMAMIINCDSVVASEKLRLLTRLAEFCCEQVDENNEHFSEAFAWHSDLMIEHFELFWSLFSVDMDRVLGELGRQSTGCQSALAATPSGGGGGERSRRDSTQHDHFGSVGPQAATAATSVAAIRDSFALFQVLNDHLRRQNYECQKFKAYLCDTFKPKLLFYLDFMESTLTRMVLKAYEKDCQVNCQLIEQTFSKLEGLQKFVLNKLCWPDEQLAEQLVQRLKLMSYELCDAILQRTVQAFQQLERKSNKWTATTTSYVCPVEMISMINLVLETRSKSQRLCTFANQLDQMSYNSKIDKLAEGALGEMQPGLMGKMLNALDSTLTKLARYDEGNLLAPILSLTYKQGMSSSGRDVGKQYVLFVSNCCDALRQKINDELWIVTQLEDWFSLQASAICTWLAERIDHSLHDVQLVALTTIMPKLYADMSLQGVSEEKLNLKSYQTIMSRLKMEEASAAASSSLLLSASAAAATSAPTASSSSPVASGGSAATQATAAASGQPAGQSADTPPSGGLFNASSILSSLSSSSSSAGGATGPTAAAAQQVQPPQARRLFAPNSAYTATSGSQLASSEADDATGDNNIADRALQSATRMFKGFWAG